MQPAHQNQKLLHVPVVCRWHRRLLAQHGRASHMCLNGSGCVACLHDFKQLVVSSTMEQGQAADAGAPRQLHTVHNAARGCRPATARSSFRDACVGFRQLCCAIVKQLCRGTVHGAKQLVLHPEHHITTLHFGHAGRDMWLRPAVCAAFSLRPETEATCSWLIIADSSWLIVQSSTVPSTDLFNQVQVLPLTCSIKYSS